MTGLPDTKREIFPVLKLHCHTATSPLSRPEGDHRLVQILDSALADASRRAGNFLACRPGCTPCCVGVFAINQLDAVRLREGLAELERSDPAGAERVRERARDSVARLSPDFPGDSATGLLADGKRAQRKFEDFANDEPCPALDPTTGTCDLYAHRPTTCRAFGPPVRSRGPDGEAGLGHCELCFHGATEEQITACEMQVDPDNLERSLLHALESKGAPSRRTIVAFALARGL